ncbi:hypothetical protein SNOG_12062 [Parastagonospora nodorum SN15]|uniref:Uncharacterized protein n=1 Tax=Phaeosphaeria nodorum (strain SN15 / ATCC MYA-4574 / FGSC 10173) TaxID=321614 RepID=Q0U852_PHANO|nr:hypothetical protein SNOG_12062 [Parastagonospora nodorum SN15]EAT80474.1 hypothetical protein SNOG_12062 [Parastagonospora nodorum SN15]
MSTSTMYYCISRHQIVLKHDEDKGPDRHATILGRLARMGCQASTE